MRGFDGRDVNHAPGYDTKFHRDIITLARLAYALRYRARLAKIKV